MTDKRQLNQEELLKFAAEAEQHFVQYIVGKYGPSELLEEGSEMADQMFEFAAHTFIESFLNGDTPEDAAIKAANSLGIIDDEKIEFQA